MGCLIRTNTKTAQRINGAKLAPLMLYGIQRLDLLLRSLFSDCKNKNLLTKLRKLNLADVFKISVIDKSDFMNPFTTNDSILQKKIIDFKNALVNLILYLTNNQLTYVDEDTGKELQYDFSRTPIFTDNKVATHAYSILMNYIENVLLKDVDLNALDLLTNSNLALAIVAAVLLLNLDAILKELLGDEIKIADEGNALNMDYSLVSFNNNLMENYEEFIDRKLHTSRRIKLIMNNIPLVTIIKDGDHLQFWLIPNSYIGEANFYKIALTLKLAEREFYLSNIDNAPLMLLLPATHFKLYLELLLFGVNSVKNSYPNLNFDNVTIPRFLQKGINRNLLASLYAYLYTSSYNADGIEEPSLLSLETDYLFDGTPNADYTQDKFTSLLQREIFKTEARPQVFKDSHYSCLEIRTAENEPSNKRLDINRRYMLTNNDMRKDFILLTEGLADFCKYLFQLNINGNTAILEKAGKDEVFDFNSEIVRNFLTKLLKVDPALLDDFESVFDQNVDGITAIINDCIDLVSGIHNSNKYSSLQEKRAAISESVQNILKSNSLEKHFSNLVDYYANDRITTFKHPTNGNSIAAFGLACPIYDIPLLMHDYMHIKHLPRNNNFWTRNPTLFAANSSFYLGPIIIDQGVIDENGDHRTTVGLSSEDDAILNLIVGDFYSPLNGTWHGQSNPFILTAITTHSDKPVSYKLCANGNSLCEFVTLSDGKFKWESKQLGKWLDKTQLTTKLGTNKLIDSIILQKYYYQKRLLLQNICHEAQGILEYGLSKNRKNIAFNNSLTYINSILTALSDANSNTDQLLYVMGFDVTSSEFLDCLKHIQSIIGTKDFVYDYGRWCSEYNLLHKNDTDFIPKSCIDFITYNKYDKPVDIQNDKEIKDLLISDEYKLILFTLERSFNRVLFADLLSCHSFQNYKLQLLEWIKPTLHKNSMILDHYRRTHPKHAQLLFPKGASENYVMVWNLVSGFFAEQFLDLGTGGYEKNKGKGRSTIDAERIVRKTDAIKRDITWTSTGEKAQQGLIHGVGETMKMAYIEDLMLPAWNASGMVSRVSVYNGAVIVNPILSMMENISYGNIQSTTKKTIGFSFVPGSSLASTFHKWAEHIKSNEYIRNTRSDINPLIITRKMLDLPIPKKSDGTYWNLTSTFLSDTDNWINVYLENNPYYYYDYETGNYYLIISVEHNGENNYLIDKVAVDKSGNPIGDTITENAKWNSLWDVYNSIGACHSFKWENDVLTESESSWELLFNMVTQVGELKDVDTLNGVNFIGYSLDNVYQPLRDCFISMIAGQEAIKNGFINKNKVTSWSDNTPLNTWTISTLWFERSLEAGHVIDEDTQVTNPTLANNNLSAMGYHLEEALNYAQGVSELIQLRNQFTLDEFKVLIDDILNERENDSVKAYLYNLKQVGYDIENPKLTEYSGAILRKCISLLNKAIRTKNSGFAGVINLGENFFELFRFGNNNFTEEEIRRYGRELVSNSIITSDELTQLDGEDKLFNLSILFLNNENWLDELNEFVNNNTDQLAEIATRLNYVPLQVLLSSDRTKLDLLLFGLNAMLNHEWPLILKLTNGPETLSVFEEFSASHLPSALDHLIVLSLDGNNIIYSEKQYINTEENPLQIALIFGDLTDKIIIRNPLKPTNLRGAYHSTTLYNANGEMIEENDDVNVMTIAMASHRYPEKTGVSINVDPKILLQKLKSEQPVNHTPYKFSSSTFATNNGIDIYSGSFALNPSHIKSTKEHTVTLYKANGETYKLKIGRGYTLELIWELMVKANRQKIYRETLITRRRTNIKSDSPLVSEHGDPLPVTDIHYVYKSLFNIVMTILQDNPNVVRTFLLNNQDASIHLCDLFGQEFTSYGKVIADALNQCGIVDGHLVIGDMIFDGDNEYKGSDEEKNILYNLILENNNILQFIDEEPVLPDTPFKDVEEFKCNPILNSAITTVNDIVDFNMDEIFDTLPEVTELQYIQALRLYNSILADNPLITNSIKFGIDAACYSFNKLFNVSNNHEKSKAFFTICVYSQLSPDSVSSEYRSIKFKYLLKYNQMLQTLKNDFVTLNYINISDILKAPKLPDGRFDLLSITRDINPNESIKIDDELILTLKRLESVEHHPAEIIGSKISYLDELLEEGHLDILSNIRSKYERESWRTISPLKTKGIIDNINGLEINVRTVSGPYSIILTENVLDPSLEALGKTKISKDIKRKPENTTFITRLMDEDSDFPNYTTIVLKYDPENVEGILEDIEGMLYADKNSIDSIQINVSSQTSDNILDNCDAFISEAIKYTNLSSEKVELLKLNNVLNSTDNSQKFLIINEYNTTHSAKYLNSLVLTNYFAFLKAKECLSLRIPTQTFSSIQSAKLVSYRNSKSNDVYVNRWLFWFQGSDLDKILFK